VSYGDCLQQGGTPEFDSAGRYVNCRGGGDHSVGGGSDGSVRNPPDRPLPAKLSITLQSPETANAGQDVARVVTLKVTNSGERPAPRGFQIQLGLYGQDPPILRYQVKNVTSLYQVNAGQTVTCNNLGHVVIPIRATTGEYNFCAKLENNTMDCRHIHVVGSGRVQPREPTHQ
jgi:hypothetical protein